MPAEAEHEVYNFLVARLYDEFDTPDSVEPSNRYCLFPEYVSEARALLRDLSPDALRVAIGSILRLSFRVRALGFATSAEVIRSVSDEHPALTREVAATLLCDQDSHRAARTRAFLGLT